MYCFFPKQQGPEPDCNTTCCADRPIEGEDNARVTHDSGWAPVRSDSYHASGGLVSRTGGSVASFSFFGSGLVVYFARGAPYYSDLSVAIDGAPPVLVNGNVTRSPSQSNYGEQVVAKGLANGAHSVTVRSLATANQVAVIDYARVTCEPCEFDEAFYLQSNPDVATAVRDGAFTSGRHHFELHGRGEGRAACP